MSAPYCIDCRFCVTIKPGWFASLFGADESIRCTAFRNIATGKNEMLHVENARMNHPRLCGENARFFQPKGAA